MALALTAMASFFLWWLSLSAMFESLIFGELFLGMLWVALRNHSPLAGKIIMATPLVFLFSLVLLGMAYPIQDEQPRVAFWERPGAFRIPGILDRVRLLPNPYHPMSRYVKLFWAELLLIWIAGWDEAVRHDVSRLFQ